MFVLRLITQHDNCTKKSRKSTGILQHITTNHNYVVAQYSQYYESTITFFSNYQTCTSHLRGAVYIYIV
jgi:hypothetical protein